MNFQSSQNSNSLTLVALDGFPLVSPGDDIAALILEPIQGEGGDNHFRGEYLRSLRELALENEFLLIFDEVQTGIGITVKCGLIRILMEQYQI